MNPQPFHRNHRAVAASLIAAAVVAISGCVGPMYAYGQRATDLSELEPGMPRSEVEAILDKPIKQRATETGSTAIYSYDRGFIPHAERQGTGTQTLALVMGGLVDLGSLGLATAVNAGCWDPCQKGNLEAHYDREDILVEAAESPAPVSGACGDPEIPSLYGRCAYITANPRASTLPESVRRKP